MIVTKPVDLVLLQQELTAAGVVVPALGTFVDTGGQTNLHTYTPDGVPLELPPEAVPVIDAHVAPPRLIEFASIASIDAVIRTTDDLPHELLRFPLALQSGYDIEARVMGVDAGNGVLKKMKADTTLKRLLAGPLQVGTMTVTVLHQDAAASSWLLSAGFAGNDAVLSVTGAAGRTIDWVCTGRVGRFAPAGLG